MANITLTIPDAIIGRLTDALATRFGYNAATDGTKAAFAKVQVIKWIKAQVREHESNTAAATAATNAAADVDTNIVIT